MHLVIPDGARLSLLCRVSGVVVLPADGLATYVGRWSVVSRHGGWLVAPQNCVTLDKGLKGTMGMRRARNNTTIDGLEANMLLFALDAYLGSETGTVTRGADGLSVAECQALRDRLFSVHEHPKE